MSSSDDNENFVAPLPAGSTYQAQAVSSFDPAITGGANRAAQVEEDEDDEDADGDVGVCEGASV